MSKSTAPQRQETTVTGDAIWRTTVNDELKATRQWNQNFEYLIPENRRIGTLLKNVSLEPNHTLNTRREIKPFYSELSMLPDEPNRRDPETRDRYLFRQSRDRVLPKSSKKKQLEKQFSVPPHLLDPMNPEESIRRYNGEMQVVSSKPIPELNNVLSKFRKNERPSQKNCKLNSAPTNQTTSKQPSTTPSGETLTPTNNTANNTVISKKRGNLGSEYKELDKRFPQQKFEAPLTTSMEIGWNPRNLEIFGVAKHGLKRIDIMK